MRKIEFKIIQNSDYSDEIRNILNEEEMESLVQVKYEKVPNLFESLQKDSEKTPIIVVGIDTENDNLVGVGACSIFKNNIGYLQGFRLLLGNGKQPEKQPDGSRCGRRALKRFPAAR